MKHSLRRQCSRAIVLGNNRTCCQTSSCEPIKIVGQCWPHLCSPPFSEVVFHRLALLSSAFFLSASWKSSGVYHHFWSSPMHFSREIQSVDTGGMSYIRSSTPTFWVRSRCCIVFTRGIMTKNGQGRRHCSDSFSERLPTIYQRQVQWGFYSKAPSMF